MTTSEKVAYLKGLYEGMAINTESGEGKLFKVIADILEDLSLEQEDINDAVDDMADCIDDITEDLIEVESILDEEDEDEDGDEEDEEEDDEDEDGDFYQFKCPGCGAELTVDEDILDDGEFECPECSEVIDFNNVYVKKVDFELLEEDDDNDQ